MTKLVILRHSRAVANDQGILMGAKLDSPLSEPGIALAHQKGKELHAAGFRPDRVYTSALKRTIQTAEIILEELGASVELTKLPSLNERDFGQYDGQPHRYVLDAFAEFGENPPTIEPVTQLLERVMQALEQIKRESTGTTLIITHSNPVMALQAALLHPHMLARFWELGDPENCEGFTFEYSSGSLH